MGKSIYGRQVMSEEDNLVVLKTFQSLPEAEIVKSFLEEKGIAIYLHDKHLNTMYGGALGTVTGGYRLRVKESELKTAQDFLTQQNPGLTDEFLQGDACPSCGSTTTELHVDEVFSLVRFLFGWVMMFPTGRQKKDAWECMDCGHKWMAPAGEGANWRSFVVFLLLVMMAVAIITSQ